MSVHRFYIAPEDWNPDALVLRESEAHHARDVLRLKSGDKLIVFNGEGREITGEICNVAKNEIRVRKLHEAQTRPLKCRITLGQAIPKGKNMDLIVQKAVEIGAAEITPLISERTIVDLDKKKAEQKRQKWQQIAIEAAKQCGQNWLPKVQTPRKMKEFLSSVEASTSPARTVSPATVSKMLPTRLPLQQSGFDLRLIGSLQSDAQHLKKRLRDYEAEHSSRPSSVLILIGPEGDFTPAELGLAKSHGCLPITLGPIILRVETASIYCLSVLSYELFSE